MADKQKDIFLQSEGDAWFSRNRQALADRKFPDGDAILAELCGLLPKESNRKLKVLEIGCGEGGRLVWLQQNCAVECYGVDPSTQAVEAATARGIKAFKAVADELPFSAEAFDVVIFGFCLYLCDRSDLFRIACEADRVLRLPGWLIIQDFFSPVPRSRIYHHRPGVISYKMDYRTLFSWHPDYECLTHKVRGHQNGVHTDDPEEWTAVSVLRKASCG